MAPACESTTERSLRRVCRSTRLDRQALAGTPAGRDVPEHDTVADRPPFDVHDGRHRRLQVPGAVGRLEPCGRLRVVQHDGDVPEEGRQRLAGRRAVPSQQVHGGGVVLQHGPLGVDDDHAVLHRLDDVPAHLRRGGEPVQQPPAEDDEPDDATPVTGKVSGVASMPAPSTSSVETRYPTAGMNDPAISATAWLAYSPRWRATISAKSSVATPMSATVYTSKNTYQGPLS